MSPFLLACASGLPDVVKLLVRKGLNASHLDDQGRGALQRAAGTQSKTIDIADEDTNLAAWLLAHATDPEGKPLEMTYGEGRATEKKRSGQVGRQRSWKQWREQKTSRKRKRS